MKRTCWILALSLAMASAGSVPAWAQNGEVVQATPSAAAVDSLNRNLALLSRTPQDVSALLGAGQAALDLGDVQAANGFYTRANMVNPNLGKAKLGLAIVQIALKQADDAAANFDAAEALGEPARGHLAERGLAYDLIGQQAKAQRDYLAAIQSNPTDKLARLRYGVSLGISGDIAAANQQLEPALAAGDREAWRMRAFIFAMNGRIADARKVTQAVMPKGLADALDPYMERVSLLTPAQKAAAAYYGEFPSNVLRLAVPEPTKERPVQVAAAEDRDASRRDRRNSSSSDRRQSRNSSSRSSTTALAAARTEPAAVPASPPSEPAPPPPQRDNVELASNEAARSPIASSARPASATPPPTAPVTRSAPSAAQSPQLTRQPATQPTYEAPAGVQLTSKAIEAPASTARGMSSSVTQGPADPRSGSPAATPARGETSSSTVPAPGFSASAGPLTAQNPAPARLSLADALSSLSVPDQERRAAPAADLAAVARIQDQRRKTSEAAAAKAKAEAEAKAKAEAAKKAEAERKKKLAANPARIWVQIATGRDVDALAFDLRRLRRSYADAVGDLGGWTAEWGATRRLLIGPFKKADEARAAVTKITKSGGDAFVWQSDAGEEIEKIGGK